MVRIWIAGFWIAVVLRLSVPGWLWAGPGEEAVGLFCDELHFVVVFFLFLAVIVFLFVVVLESFPDELCVWNVGDFIYGTRFCEVEAFGGGFDGADGVGGVGFGVEASGVVAGELEAVEQGGGSLDVELAGGEGVDDDGESNLDGFAVFEGGELEVLAGDEVAASGGGVAEGGVALVEAVVEVAPGASGECGAFALQAVGFDVAAEFVLHGFSLGVPLHCPAINPMDA
jgi:hypothetical protein